VFINLTRARAFSARVLCLLHILCFTSVWADGAQDLEISKAWLRATPPGAAVGAGYFTVHNNGKKTLRVIGIQTALAKRAEIHQSLEHEGHEQMRFVEEGLSIAPGQSVALTPGGYHIMLMGLDHALAAGTSASITLLLDDGSKLTTTTPVLTEWPTPGNGGSP